ncbi:MAG: STAS domain-containing protein [Desulfobulbus sp.]
MLNIVQEIAGDSAVILHLGGDLDIETAADLREALLEGFAGPQTEVRIDGNDLASIDFFGLQLLCSAHRTALAKNKTLTWMNGRPSQLSDAMRVTGFTRHCGCALCPPDIDCMWV